MKPVFLIGLGLATYLQAQIPASDPASPSPQTPVYHQTAPGLRTEAELRTLLAPIALYPDALIALILPASTMPSDIVLAARYIGTNTTPETLAAQPWDDSIKALTHYPELLRWLDQNLAWTQAVGDAFTAQPADVMNAVQHLRKQARAAGTLTDTPQQQIITEEEAVRIEPAQPDLIYVPVYDPTITYVSHPIQREYSYLHFHSGYPVGPWLTYIPNWRQCHIRVVTHTPDRWRHSYRNPPSHSQGGRLWTPPSQTRFNSRQAVTILPSHQWSPHHEAPSRANAQQQGSSKKIIQPRAEPKQPRPGKTIRATPPPQHIIEHPKAAPQQQPSVLQASPQDGERKKSEPPRHTRTPSTPKK